MTLRILSLHQDRPSNPFLSAAVANRRWLVPALRERGHTVDESPAPGAAYDLVHSHGPASSVVAPTVTTTYRAETEAAPAVATAARLVPAGASRADVIYPPIDADLVPLEREPDDSLVIVFDGRDEFVLAAAIAIATRTERPLTVVMETSTEVSESCAAALEAGTSRGWMEVVRYGPDGFPAAIAEAAAFLSLSRTGFDMGALTALACGTPIITIRDAAAAEIVIHGESGFVAEQAEHAALFVDRVDMLSSAKARARARMVFDPATAAARYAHLFEAVVRGEIPRFVHPELPGRERPLRAGSERGVGAGQ